MIKRDYNINVRQLIAELLPLHKRQSIRMHIITSLADVQRHVDWFAEWRGQQRRMINISAQVMVLEGYLRLIYDRRITVQTYYQALVGIGLVVEGRPNWARVGRRGHAPTLAMPLRGEVESAFEGYDFLVTIPPNVDIRQITAEIERYKLADKTYKIIQK